MSAVRAVRYLLANNANLIAVVPATKIMAGVIPLNTVLPAISVSEISSIENTTVAMVPTLMTSRVQVTVMAKTYATQKSILELVRLALPVSRGTVDTIAVDSIIPEGAGPDLRDDDAGIFIQSRDFIVRFTI